MVVVVTAAEAIVTVLKAAETTLVTVVRTI
jgi:hypothetical protein